MLQGLSPQTKNAGYVPDNDGAGSPLLHLPAKPKTVLRYTLSRFLTMEGLKVPSKVRDA